MLDIRETLRDRFRMLCDEYMQANRVSEAEVARLLGFSTSKMSRLLSIQIRIGFQEAQTITDFFGVSIAWLCGESEIREKLSSDMQSAIKGLMAASAVQRN